MKLTSPTPLSTANASRIAGIESPSDVYARFTAQIIAAIESGAGSWTMPWNRRRDPSGAYSMPTHVMPTNVTTGKAYKGVNVLALWAAATEADYPTSEWGTYKQWAEKGAQVRKGEKATFIVFWKFFDKAQKGSGGDATSAPDATGDSTSTSPTSAKSATMMARGYSVFNAAQVDGYISPVPVTPAPADVPATPVASVDPSATSDPTPDPRLPSVDAFFASIGVDLRHGGDRACYSPLFDYVKMPEFADFHSTAAYYGTLAHEYTHWTGHSSRLDRDLKGRFGDAQYAAEELIAELGAAFLCGHLDLYTEPRPDHAQYLSHWLSILKADKRAIFTAASKAQQAVDWMIERAGGAGAGPTDPANAEETGEPTDDIRVLEAAQR